MLDNYFIVHCSFHNNSNSWLIFDQRQNQGRHERLRCLIRHRAPIKTGLTIHYTACHRSIKTRNNDLQKRKQRFRRIASITEGKPSFPNFYIFLLVHKSSCVEKLSIREASCRSITTRPLQPLQLPSALLHVILGRWWKKKFFPGKRL